MTYGVTSTGFSIKPQDVILAELKQDHWDTIDPALDLGSDTPWGQSLGIQSKKLAELWELAQAIYASYSRSGAQGFALDAVGEKTGLRREKSKKSFTTVATVNLDAGITLTAGKLIHITGQEENRWVLRADVTNSGGSPADISCVFDAESVGPQAWNDGVAAVIISITAGWNNAKNVGADATLGRLVQGDTEYRQDQQASLQAEGSGTVDAIRSALLDMDGVVQADCFENTGDVTDANGLPPHSIEAVVYDGTSPLSNDAIAQVIWDNKGDGIPTFGSSSGTATDTNGVAWTVNFSRPTAKPIYMEYTLTKNTNPLAGPVFPSDGLQQVKDKAVALANAFYHLGTDVVALLVRSYAFQVAGVVDVPTFTLGFTAMSGGTTNLAIAGRELATFSTTRITVA